MTRRTSSSPRLWAAMVLLAAPWALHGQCLFSLVDAFDDEVPVDLSSLDPDGCATLSVPLLSPNWHNVSVGDQTDWLPHEGGTPTNGTGPFSTNYVLPYVPNLNTLGFLSPTNAEGWGFNPFIAVNDCTSVPLPEASPSQPYLISEETLDVLQNFFAVWPGIGGLLGSPYLVVEATGCCEGTAVLESDSISMAAYDNIQLAFRHHMQGATMGSLVFETSLDGGFTWEQHWAQIGAAGSYWKQETVDLTSVLAGAEAVLMRFVATVGPGDLSDIALDDISLLALPTPLTVFEDSVLTYAQLEENCWIQVEFDKPSDSGLACFAEAEVEEAELQLNLSLGERFRYGETSLGDGVDLQLEVRALDAAGQPIAACSAPDTVRIRITDDRHPEQLYVHDFKACYADVDHFEVIVLGLDTAGADFPDFVNDIEFHVQVNVEERFLAHDQTVTLNPPAVPSGTLAPVQFSWNADCDFPAYRFELLRLHKVNGALASPCGAGGGAGPIRAYAARSDWVASALTLEVYEKQLDLTMMEGTGYYAWRVQPIGDFHPGGEGNDLNYGRYSSFSTLNPDVQGQQTFGDGCEPGVFWYEDPNDGGATSKNRSMKRTFARNAAARDELLIQEEVTYTSEDGFASQRQTHVRSQELTLIQQGVRDFSGRERLSILPVPLSDGLKGNLDHEPTLVEADGGFYGAEAFDGDETFREPLAMEGAVSDYYSDANPDQGVPHAGGYPFSDTTYTRDGTNRPMVIGAQGPVKRMKQGQDARVTRILYGSVGESELIRVFGHEAPDVGSVEKVMTINPESVTRVDYIDEQGRTIASCLSANSAMDDEKIVGLAPDEGFTSSRMLDAEQVGPHKWEVFHEFALTEQTNVELDYSLESLRFQALCGDFCAACDYRAVFKLVETDAMEVVLQDTLIVPGEVLSSCTPAAAVEWTESLSLGEGRYQFVQSVEHFTSDGDQLYLDGHVQTVLAEVDGRLEEVTTPLMTILNQVTAEDVEALDNFYGYCEEVADGTSMDEEGVVWFRFDVGEDCDDIEVPFGSCPYDCHPATRDFEAFFNDAVAREYLNYVDTATTPVIPTREDIPMVFGQVVGRTTSGGALPSGAHAFFPQWQSSDEPGTIRNVAANSYGVMEGQFNQLIENLIHDGEAFPEIYPGYTCYNIHYKLEAIAEQHIYTFADTVVADLLLDELGRHFRDLRLPGQDGVNGAGFLADPSVPLGDQGWTSHPHKFLRAPDPQDPCVAEGSMFAITAQAVDLVELSYSTPEKRDIIESTYNILYNCLEGPDGESVEQGLSGGNGEGEAGQTEFGADGVTAENILEVWERDCREAIAAKRSVYEEVAEDFIDVDGSLAGSVWSGENLLNRDCLVAQLVEHAESLCYLPHQRLDTIGPLVESPDLVDDAFFRVADGGSGEFIRYGGAEYGAHAANQELHCIEALHGTAFEEVKNAVALKEFGFGILPEWTDEDVQRIAAITYGSVELCAGDCDTTTFELLPSEVAVATEGDTVFSDDFEEVMGGQLPVVVGQEALDQWEEMHDAGGDPTVVEWGIGEGADNEVLLSSFPNAEEGFVVGNGIRASKSIAFVPGEEYEIELTIRYVQGRRMDHLFAAIAPGAWYPECADPPYETFYPPAYTNVIGNWYPHVGYGGDNDTYTLRASFTWEPMSGAPAAIAPSQQLENPDADGNIGFLHLYPKQYLQSDSVVISVDDVYIIHKSQAPSCDSLYVRYNILTPQPDTTRIETCEEQWARQLRNQISDQAAAIRNRRAEEVREAYVAACAPQDGLTISHPLRLYHYTLQYYDAAGRLARTVPPKGVDVDDSHTRASIPDHTHVTEYAYNGLGHLVRTETPDGGVVRTWYDRLERVRFTQTAQDVLDGQYRYICYDSKSRPIRSGVDALGGEVLDLHVDDVDWPADDPTDATDCAECQERVTTVYGVPIGGGFEQTHLVDRLSYIVNEEGDTIAYSYDSQGRTAALYQHVAGLGSSLLEYDYDEATDQVREIVLNRGLADAFHLRMEYDEDERVVRRFSSDDGRIWHRDVDVQFYEHGPVKREELGHYGVQGVDYTYNIHGELMAINTPSLDKADDPGEDGVMGAGDWVSEDVFGMQLGRYRGEFGRTDSPLLTEQTAHAEAADLYNGEIASVTFQQRHDFGDGLGRVGHRVQYDELSRIRDVQFRIFQSGWLSDASRHSGQYGYDGNGNLTTLIRSGDGETGTLDALTFQYAPENNWLTHVDDAQGASVTGLDVADQQPDNYQYDADGRLTGDAAEGITEVMWRADGKVDRVVKTDAVITFRYNPLRHRVAKIVSSGDQQDTTWYVRGQEGEILAVYRSQDEGPPTVDFRTIKVGTAEPDTVPIAFASTAEPTALFTRYVGGRRLQLKDHLGSIRAVVSDLEAATDSDGDGHIDQVMARILSASDHHAFGSRLTGRHWDSIPHFFAYQGKELDDELKGPGNSYDFHARLYDPRLGRWMSRDPLEQSFAGWSPYNFVLGNPISLIDPDGKLPNPHDLPIGLGAVPEEIPKAIGQGITLPSIPTNLTLKTSLFSTMTTLKYLGIDDLRTISPRVGPYFSVALAAPEILEAFELDGQLPGRNFQAKVVRTYFGIKGGMVASAWCMKSTAAAGPWVALPAGALCFAGGGLVAGEAGEWTVRKLYEVGDAAVEAGEETIQEIEDAGNSFFQQLEDWIMSQYEWR